MDKTTLRRRAVLGSIATIGIGGGVVYGASRLDSDDSSTVSAQMHTTGGSGAFGVELADHPIMGALDAPVSIYYWSEYQCPFCARFEAETFPQIIRNYVHPGDVRVIFSEFPYIGQDSITAAVANKCVWRQVRNPNPDAYWSWHSAVFESQGEENSGWASKKNILEITSNTDAVPVNGVRQCMDQNQQAIEKAIESSSQQARALGISGTPGFIIYNRQSEQAGKIVGAQPYDQFESAIKRVKNA